HTPPVVPSGWSPARNPARASPGATPTRPPAGGSSTPPPPNPDPATTFGPPPAAISVLANDTDPTGFLVPGSVTVTSGPSHGSVTVNPTTGQVTYTAFAGFLGTDRFSYTVTDNFGMTSDPATVTGGVGQAPPPLVRP